MDTNLVSNISSAISTTSKPEYNKKAEDAKEAVDKTKFSEEAAVYEKSKPAANPAKMSKADRASLVAQMQADAEANKAQLLNIVRNEITRQGQAIGASDDIWHILASGDFEASPEAIAQAKKDIAEDGYWGVEQTSDRIVEFAKALSGGDPAKADELFDAFVKGFQEATKTWGRELPDISKRTYEAVEQKFNDWKNSVNAGE
ncbi:MAG: hypothetical protein IJ655_00535 [Lachnospiraceae bacterium]|nr:hypothetical protein [Lachnospiraceae bacterium]